MKSRPIHAVCIALAGVVACGDEGIIEPGEGPPARLEFPGPSAGATAFVGNVVAPAPVRVLDSKGRPLADVAVQFHLDREGQLAWFSAASDAEGYAAPSGWRLGGTPGVQRLIAETGDLSASLAVQVIEAPPSEFKIEVVYENDAGLLSRDRLAIEGAVGRWQTLVIGDLPDMQLPSTFASGCPNTAALRGRVVDDLLLVVTIGSIPGASASTTLCARRGGGGLPAMAYIRLDPVASSFGEGVFAAMEHEIAHALGFGIIWFGDLFDERNGDPHFMGRTAVAAYQLASGVSAPGVPVEASGGQAVARTLWRESVFGVELLTPFSNRAFQPLSAITVSALRDLGYVVDDAKADPYSPAVALVSKGDSPAWRP